MVYFLSTAISYSLNRYSMFNPLMRYFSSTIIDLDNMNKWWKPGTENSASNDIKPYNIIFSEERVKELKYKLRNSDILKKPMLSKSEHYDTENIKMFFFSNFLHYWAYNYDFKERERYINSFPHFITNIQGLDIHFIHVKQQYEEDYNTKRKFLPLLILHGWQGSITEFCKNIPLELKTEREIIIPSLPGFGFSSAPTIPGFSFIDSSIVLKNLMLRLGHDKFNVMYDFSEINGQIMLTLFRQHGSVNSYMNLRNSTDKGNNYFFTKFLKQIKPIKTILKEFGYFQVQASEMNNTVAIDLNNSPAALAAYFLHENLNRTYPSDYFKKYFNDEFRERLLFSHDHTIDNLMIYWASQCINTAMQLYMEQFYNLSDEFIEFLYQKYKQLY